GVSLEQASVAIERTVARLNLPTEVQGMLGGTGGAFQQTQQNQPWMILLALVVVYIVLGVLYESYIHPLTILSTLPSAGVGALLALQLMSIEFSLISLLGLFLLIGIVKKNGIMMVDFALDAERHRGLSSADAIFEACSARFRPILMTTLAALFAGIPLVIATGPGTELRRPLGITIIGGMMVSQILTLYTTPVIYLLIDRLRRRWRFEPKAVAAPAE
ncbi:MAG: efflux RND transporter permease subunit, partial [Bradyrhizobium sp.]|nr:efflux RND transporter permease subunit [Bradyrhizobium sp.]